MVQLGHSRSFGRLVSILSQVLISRIAQRRRRRSTRPRKIFERRVAERTEELRRQVLIAQHERDRLMTLINSMSEGVWLTDAKGEVLLANPAAIEQATEVGIDAKSFRGPTSEKVLLLQVEVTFADGKQLGFGYASQNNSGEAYQPERDQAAQQGRRSRLPPKISANEVKDREGGTVGAVVLVQDMTEQKRAEDERPVWRSAFASHKRWRPSGPSPEAWPMTSTTCSPWSWATPSFPRRPGRHHGPDPEHRADNQRIETRPGPDQTNPRIQQEEREKKKWFSRRVPHQGNLRDVRGSLPSAVRMEVDVQVRAGPDTIGQPRRRFSRSL